MTARTCSSFCRLFEEQQMALKVVQWATGGVGVAAIKGVLEHPDLELVGCRVYSPDKDGKDVGELHRHRPARCHGDEQRRRDPGPRRRRGDLRATDGQPRRGGCAAAVRQERRHAGRLAVSQREAGRPDARSGPRGNATLHGTGIAPGGISEKFPLLFSVLSTGVTFVRAEEFSDLRTYEAPDVLRHVMGFGEPRRRH